MSSRRGPPRGQGGDRSGRGQGRGGAPPRGGTPDRGDFSGRGDRGAPRGDFRGGGGGGGFRGGRGGGGPPAGALLFSPSDTISPPSAEVTKAEDKAIASSKELSLSALKVGGQTLPRRPGYGTIGQPILLRTNYFQILPKPGLQLFRYQVEVEPDPKVARRRRRAFELLVSSAPFLASVGPVATDFRSMLVTMQKLNLGPNDRGEFKIQYYEREDDAPATGGGLEYNFKVSYTTTYSIQELLDHVSSPNAPTYEEKDSTIQALNVAMSRRPANDLDMAILPGANKFFRKDAVVGNLGGGLVALRGYYTSVRTATLRLLLNVNSVTSIFYKSGTAFQLMKDFKDGYRGPLFELALNNFLKGVRVEVTYLRTRRGGFKTKVIAGIARRPVLAANSEQMTFHWDDINAQISVKDYFMQKYNKNVEISQAPVINLGNTEHPMYVPPEFCNVIPGQIAKKKLSPEQTQEMIKYACRKPADNARLIVDEGAKVMGIGQADGPMAFGLKIWPEMLSVPGRILAAPSVTYGGNKTVPAAFGSWNMIKVKFSVGAKIENWGYSMIQYGDRAPVTGLPALMGQFKSMMEACGLRVLGPGTQVKALQLNQQQSHTHDAAIEKWIGNARNQKVKMLFVVLPVKSQTLYASLKYFADVKHGVHTICSVGSKLQKDRNEQYLANIALKWNLKAGGINQQIPSNKMGILSSSMTMVVGIDVTHPSPGSRGNAPSVAGVVASVDRNFGQWPASVRCQESRKEMVTDLEKMIVQRLKVFQRHNANKLPTNILVYRDGVSEGQYLTVLEQESPAFDKAIASMYSANAPKPKVSIIIVGKRHHTRFYPTQDKDMDRSGNPKNGTVVDRGVTSERYWDFFLQAHTGLQGTARPAHYVVVQDQIGLGADGLEQLTHNLCYLFGRATKAVSICPPAYYADLLCERARCYLYDTFNQDNTSSGTGEWNPNTARWLSGVHRDLEDTMFYI